MIAQAAYYAHQDVTQLAGEDLTREEVDKVVSRSVELHAQSITWQARSIAEMLAPLLAQILGVRMRARPFG